MISVSVRMSVMAKERILIQLDDFEMGRVRLLSFQTRTPFAAIVRRCVREAIDKVELEIIADAKMAGRWSNISPDELERTKLLGDEIGEPKAAGPTVGRRSELGGVRSPVESEGQPELTKQQLLEELAELKEKIERSEL